MKKAICAALLSLAAATACFAQENGAGSRPDSAEVAGIPSLAAPLSSGFFSGALRTTAFPAPRAAAAAKPAPRPAPRREEVAHWQIGLAYTYVRFRSTPLSANLNGFDTSLAYMMDRRLGIEGSVTAAFSTLLPNFANEHAKFLNYMGGLRYTWPRQKFEPWMHVLAGGVHLQPQLAGVGRNGFAYAAGGGVDVPLSRGIAARVQGNWVGTRLFGETQNHIQIAAGFLFHL